MKNRERLLRPEHTLNSRFGAPINQEGRRSRSRGLVLAMRTSIMGELKVLFIKEGFGHLEWYHKVK